MYTTPVHKPTVQLKSKLPPSREMGLISLETCLVSRKSRSKNCKLYGLIHETKSPEFFS